MIGKTLRNLSLGVLLALITSTAYGSGFLVSKSGGDSAGPMVGSVSSIYWNPAAIGFMTGSQLYVDNNLLFRDASFTPRGAAPGADSGQQGLLRSVKSQPMVGIVTDAGTERFRFGLALYSPFGSSSVWEDPEGPQRYEAIHGRIRSIYVTPTVAMQLPKGFHIGVGLSYVDAKVQSYRALDFGGLVSEITGNPVTPAQLGNEGRVALDFEGAAMTWSTGLAWASKDWRVGLSYSAEVDMTLDGSLKVLGPRNDFYQGLLGGDIEEAAQYRATWPRIIRSGIAWKPGRWGAQLTAEWVQWGMYDRVVIDVENNDVAGLGNFDQVRETHWRDTVNVRVGTRYTVNDRWTLFGGIGGENGAMANEHIRADIFDATKVGAALGAEWQMTERFLLTTGYSHIVFLPTEVGDSGHSPSTQGRHEQQVAFLNTNLSWRFAR